MARILWPVVIDWMQLQLPSQAASQHVVKQTDRAGHVLLDESLWSEQRLLIATAATEPSNKAAYNEPAYSTLAYNHENRQDTDPGQTGAEEVRRQQLDKVLDHAGVAGFGFETLPCQNDPPDHPVGGRADHI